MDTSTVINMAALWPERDEERRLFEVLVTVPRQDGGEPFAPRALPGAVLGCWSGDALSVSMTVLASRPSLALTVAEVLVPELAGAPGATVTVKV